MSRLSRRFPVLTGPVDHTVVLADTDAQRHAELGRARFAQAVALTVLSLLLGALGADFADNASTLEQWTRSLVLLSPGLLLLAALLARRLGAPPGACRATSLLALLTQYLGTGALLLVFLAGLRFIPATIALTSAYALQGISDRHRRLAEATD